MEEYIIETTWNSCLAASRSKAKKEVDWGVRFGMNQTAQSGETRGPEIRSADIAPSSMKRTKAARHHLVIDAAGSEGCFGQTPEHSSSKTQGLTNLFDFFQLTLLGLFVARWRSFATVWKQT